MNKQILIPLQALCNATVAVALFFSAPAVAVDINAPEVRYQMAKAAIAFCPAGDDPDECLQVITFIEDELPDDGYACSVFIGNGLTRSAWFRYFKCILDEYEQLDKSPARPAKAKRQGVVTINTIRLNVRNAPNTGGAVLGTFKAGDQVAIFCVSGSWGAIDENCSQWLNLHYTTTRRGF